MPDEPASFDEPGIAGLLWSHKFTLAGCALLVFTGAQMGGGFMAWFFAVPLAPLLAYSLWRIVFRPRERKWRVLRMGLWAVAVLIVVVTQHHFAAQARAVADDAVERVRAFKQRTGTWPKRLDEAGLDSKELMRTWRLFYYYEAAKAPYAVPGLGYKDTFNGFDRYYYDFADGKWQFRPD